MGCESLSPKYGLENFAAACRSSQYCCCHLSSTKVDARCDKLATVVRRLNSVDNSCDGRRSTDDYSDARKAARRAGPSAIAGLYNYVIVLLWLRQRFSIVSVLSRLQNRIKELEEALEQERSAHFRVCICNQQILWHILNYDWCNQQFRCWLISVKL